MSKQDLEISVSLLSANFASIPSAVSMINESGASMIHFDVMDGAFVPPITFGSKMIEDIRSYSDLPFDVHLMVAHPEAHVSAIAEAGADIITVHAESTAHLHRVLSQISAYGVNSGVAINPATPVSAILPVLEYVDLVLVMTVDPGYGGQKLIQSCLDKVIELNEIRENEGYSFKISVDGGINLDTAEDVAYAGADYAVIGSAFYKESDGRQFIERVKNIASEAKR